jgi:hypothetical protein
MSGERMDLSEEGNQLSYTSPFSEQKTPLSPCLRDEVKQAVSDIMFGEGEVSSHTEWLQREFRQLMKREAEWKFEEERLRSELRSGRK